jgi:hypothetical protein
MTNKKPMNRLQNRKIKKKTKCPDIAIITGMKGVQAESCKMFLKKSNNNAS